MSSTQQLNRRLLELLLSEVSSDTQVDAEKLVDALGLTSVQQLAFIKKVNTEFGLNITPEELEKANVEGGGLVSLVEEQI